MGNRLTGGKRRAEEAPCEQPRAQRVHTDPDDADLSDEEYDPAEALSPAEAKRLEELAVRRDGEDGASGRLRILAGSPSVDRRAVRGAVRCERRGLSHARAPQHNVWGRAARLACSAGHGHARALL